MEKREPVIIVTDYTNDELHAWMQKKYLPCGNWKHCRQKKPQWS